VCRARVYPSQTSAALPPPLDPEFPDEPLADPAGEVAAQLERLKWFCWHGALSAPCLIVYPVVQRISLRTIGVVGCFLLLYAQLMAVPYLW
jgi:hypothetical protein